MPDIFISFAHVDNTPCSGETEGWITHFFRNLCNEVNRLVGRAEDCRVWMDHCLKGSDEVTPEIEKQLNDAHALVILLSSGWLESYWCQRELEIFSRRQGTAAGRIFVVRLKPLNTEKMPDALHDLLGYPFWKQMEKNFVQPLGYPVPQSSDTTYYERLVEISDHLATTLKSKIQGMSKPKATVYVAPVDESLFEQRAILISGLRQYGIDTLPRADTLDDNMSVTLEKCSYFVQLLDAHWTMGVPVKQHHTAEAAGKPILQWRDPKLDFTGTQVNKDQKKLLKGNNVKAILLNNFIRMVREAVLPKPQEDGVLPGHNGAHMVFVQAGQDDFGHAKNIAESLKLKSKRFGYFLPSYEGNPANIRESVVPYYQLCDTLLLLQQKTPNNVVAGYLTDAWKYILKRETKPRILLCRCAGADEEELHVLLPCMSTLVCRDDFTEHCLEQFLAEVAA